MENNDDIIIINTDNLEQAKEGNNLLESRSNIEKAYYQKEGSSNLVVDIAVLAYNRLEKTKFCIESLLKNTSDVDYNLILIDSGSSDGTLEYFKSIQYEKKKVIRITKNMGSSFGVMQPLKFITSEYFVMLTNDTILTKNWLSNMLKCIDSDKSIGMVVPMSSNVSNYQDPFLDFSNLDEMHEKATKFNVSDKRKWHERLRLITIATLYRKTCLDIVGIPGDYGFFHDFSDDDITFRIRRAGYKTVLCKDVWIHHNHNYNALEGKNCESFNKSIEVGRNNFRDKYFGVDAWEDANNFETSMTDMINNHYTEDNIHILGVDVRCGTPILEVKNKLKEFDKYNVKLSAFSEDAKYYVDLKTICEGTVSCNRVDFISEYFDNEQFDYIILGKPINFYGEAMKLLNDMTKLLRTDGQLLIKFRNTYDINTLIAIFGIESYQDEGYPIHWSVDDFVNILNCIGLKVVDMRHELYSINVTTELFIKNMLRMQENCKNIEESFKRIITRDYVLSIEKS